MLRSKQRISLNKYLSMFFSSDNEDVDLFIEAVLQRDPLIKPEADKETFLLVSNDPQESSAHEPLSSQIHDKNKEKNISQKATPKFQTQSSKTLNSRPKDYLKNMYNNSLKYIVKRYISKTYQQKVHKIHKKLGINDAQQAKSYYRIRQQETIGLTNLCNLLNYDFGSCKQRKFKKAFHIFYVWFMKCRYPLHILQTGKLQHADVYWKVKNILIYLPEIKRKDNSESSCHFLE